MPDTIVIIFIFAIIIIDLCAKMATNLMLVRILEMLINKNLDNKKLECDNIVQDKKSTNNKQSPLHQSSLSNLLNKDNQKKYLTDDDKKYIEAQLKENESFDAILCTEVLEHILYPIEAIKELSRLLKTDGKLILTAPFCSLTHFAPYHFVSGFNQYWYNEILPQFNLEIISMESYGNYFEYLGQELHRLLHVASLYCELPSVSPNEIESIKIVMELLERYHSISKDSNQLLNFGFMIMAKKKGVYID